MFRTILAFIKAHTIATAITATVVVSTSVATPIIINQLHNNQEQASEQVQENVIKDSETEEVSEENIIETENIIEEEKTTTEETIEESVVGDSTKNDTPTKPNTQIDKNTSNHTQEVQSVTQSNQGTWEKYNFDEHSYILINKTTQKVKPFGCNGNVVDEQEYTYSGLKSIIIPEMRKYYQECIENNKALDDKNWQEFGIPKENKIKQLKAELSKLDRFKNYVLNSGEEYSMNKIVTFEGTGNYVFHPDWIDTYKQQVIGFIESEQNELEPYITNRHIQEEYIREKMVIFEANVNVILSNL